MRRQINTIEVCNLKDYISALIDIEKLFIETERYFRGESEDFEASALKPSIYRDIKLLENESTIYREMQRFNDHEFRDDKTTIDKLSRMQHYSAPTRLTDMSEDALGGLYFALEGHQNENRKEVTPVVYVIDVVSKDIRYYDSDAVGVLANLVKSPLSSAFSNNSQKNKQAICFDAIKFRSKKVVFNKQKSIQFLLHDIKEEKPYFSSIIDPRHIFSVKCVKPKFTSSRINSQKGAFLLFGLNPDNISECIHLIQRHGSDLYLSDTGYGNIQHPIERITKIVIKTDSIESLKTELKSIGIKTPFIYPEMDKVAGYLKAIYKTGG